MNTYKLPSVKPQVKKQVNKYDNIQVFRFIAALMVIILHSTFYTHDRLQSGFPLYHVGANGVRLFFAISGFVMIISSENLRKRQDGWKIFAVKRIIRIVPIYWIITTYKVLVLIFASSLVFHASIDPGYILKSYFFIPAKNVEGELAPLLGVGWTLNFEMFFYLLFTVALAFRFNTLVFLSMIFIPLSVLSIFKTSFWPDLSFYANPIMLDFLYGMVAAKLILNNKKLPPPLAISITLLGLLYLFLPGVDAMARSGLHLDNIIGRGIAAFLVVYGGACVENLTGQKMPAWLVYLGGASYSLYLIHPIIAPLTPTLLKIFHLKWPWLSVVLSIFLAVAAGTAFYRFCEKPVTQFLTKRARQRKLV